MSVLIILLSIGLVARLTRLISTDYITRHGRAFVIRHLGPDHDIAYLIACPYCLSVWIAGGVFSVAWFCGGTAAFVIVSAAATASYLTGVVATFVEADD